MINPHCIESSYLLDKNLFDNHINNILNQKENKNIDVCYLFPSGVEQTFFHNKLLNDVLNDIKRLSSSDLLSMANLLSCNNTNNLNQRNLSIFVANLCFAFHIFKHVLPQQDFSIYVNTFQEKINCFLTDRTICYLPITFSQPIVDFLKEYNEKVLNSLVNTVSSLNFIEMFRTTKHNVRQIGFSFNILFAKYKFF